MKKKNEPAFPVPDHKEISYGLSKRELLAAMAMQAAITATGTEFASECTSRAAREKGIDALELLAKASVYAADVLLAELEKDKK